MKRSYPDTVFLNGQWLPHEQATIPVFDRGFMLGDGIYEVVPFYGHRLFTLEAHMDRLQNGLAAVGITYAVAALKKNVVEAVSRASYRDGIVYMQVIRGVAPRTHYFPSNVEPTVLLYASPFAFTGFEQKAVGVVLSSDFRWQRCNVKSISLMANVLANNEAHERGMAEYVFEREGIVTEGSHTSVFFVRDGILFTHPNGRHILPGITRDVVISIAAHIGIEVRESGVLVTDLPQMEEAFLTGTTMQITAIRSFLVDDHELGVGTGGVGPVTRQLQRAFIERIEAL